MAQVFENSNAKPRRTGNHHPNLWTDDFIQSIASPYGDSSYYEDREVLISEIRDILSNGEETFSLFERMSFVAVLQRLGIDRYFRNEIKMSLDHVHKYWSHNIIDDLNMAALGFWILRLNRYDVSPDVFKKFKRGEDWKFFGIGCSPEERDISVMLSLYKASELDFPNEGILKEIRVLTATFLQQATLEYEDLKEHKSPLLMEIDYTLKYSWRSRIPRWEAWNFINILKEQICNETFVNNIYRISNIATQKLLQLAILDFNILQAQHQIELKQISTWWKHSRAIELDFFRHRHVEFYWWTTSLFELEHSASRIATTKLITCLSLLDDIYDTHGTYDELKPFTMALLRSDSSQIDNQPEYMKIAFDFTQQIHKEILGEAETNHGPFVNKYIRSCWESYISSYFQEAEWIASNHTPSFEKYLSNGVTSSGMRVILIHSLVLMRTPLSNEVLEKLDIPSSKLQSLISLTTRLVDDCKDFEDEKARGEIASSIECYMKDNSGSTREEGLDYLKNYIECCVQELNEEFLKPSDIPDYYKSLYFNFGMQGIFFLFREVDGFSDTKNKGIQDAITKILVEPIIPYP